MSIYDDLKPVVNELLGEFKQGIISLIKLTPGTGPIDNPGAPTETEYLLKAVVNGVSSEFVRQGLATQTDLEVTSAPIEGVDVTEKDYILIDGTRYKIVSDMSRPAAGTVLVWKLIVRKGG